MTDPPLTLRPAEEAALSDVEDLLEANGLPSADVRSAPAQFYVAFHCGDRVGVGGLERYGSDALVRSVVVAESARGAGLGSALCDRLEARAREAGVERLFLLTTTAAEFFSARGYAEIDRSEAPAAIRQTTEFAELCSDAATCLRKRL